MFGRYELQDLLGRGGMGEVYRAVDTVRDRTVALKLLPKHLAADESFKTRFRRESRTAARLNDPHIVPIHDFGEIDGQLFIDMRLVEGRDLGSVLVERHALSTGVGVKILSQVASALEAAHQSGLVHRDVKPSNVLLAGWSNSEEDEPFAYLVDFGIARAANQEGTALTATSGTVGTVAYMSPERIGGSPGDRRTDIYALGCVLFETLAGRKPFDGEIFAIMYAHMNTPPPRLTQYVPDAPRALDDVITKAMAKEPNDRFATASEFALAARQALRGGPPPISTAPLTGPTYAPPPPAGPPTAPHPSAPLPPYIPQQQPQAAPQYPPPQYPPPQPSAPIPPPQQRPPAPATTSHAPFSPPGYAEQQAAPSQQRPSPPPATGPPPGPGRPATPSGPVRPPSWSAPPQHPSGPIGPPPLPPASSGKRRGVLIAVAVAVVAAVVLTLVFTLGGNSSNPPQGQSGSSGSPPNSSAPAGPASYKTGGPSTPVVDWAHFGSYSALVGTTNGDTAHAFQDGNCTLSGIGSSDPTGLLDQVQCSYQGSPVTADVARFQDKHQVLTFLNKLSAHLNYAVAPFKINDRIVGMRYTAPASEKDVNVITFMCGLPDYLVQFFAPDSSKTTPQSVLDNYWSGSMFPDVVPEDCNSDFSGIKTGATPTLTGVGGIKTVTGIDDRTLESWAQFQQRDWDVALVDIPAGAEMIVVEQTKQVSFWHWDKAKHEITHGGFSTYPYDPTGLGQPQATARGALLTGMSHATFIVKGNFSGDGSGNAVAYTDSTTKGWGAIKAIPNGNLAPSGQGVAVSGIGLSQDFDFVDGLLETADCSSNIPISECGGNNRILKFWRWSGAQFVLDHSAGLSH